MTARDCKTQNSFDCMPASIEPFEKQPMHPDDFTAHLAWVTAKQFHEFFHEKTGAIKKTDYYRIDG